MTLPVTDGPPLHAIDFRLSYGECDPAGIVYFASLFPWTERVHSEWWYLVDEPIRSMEERWGASPVTRFASCEYLERTTLHDHLRCEMRVASTGRTSYRLRFDFLRVAGAVPVACSEMTLVFVDAGGRAAPVPTALREMLERAAAA